MGSVALMYSNPSISLLRCHDNEIAEKLGRNISGQLSTGPERKYSSFFHCLCQTRTLQEYCIGKSFLPNYGKFWRHRSRERISYSIFAYHLVCREPKSYKEVRRKIFE